MISKSKLKDKFKKLLLTRVSTSKELFYAKNFIKYSIPQSFYKQKLDKIIRDGLIDDKDSIYNRVHYYNKLKSNFTLNNGTLIKDFKFRHKFSIYYFDTYDITKYFNVNNKFSYVFGDVIEIPKEPSFVKSRPIKDNNLNENSVLLKLNKIRHYGFIKDKINFSEKIDKAMWRGDVTDTKIKRINLLEKHFTNPLCDIGVTSRKFKRKEWLKDKITIKEQLKFKYILSIEGHDVATNLKWIMSSNSIAVMPKPEFETWFMEGTLIPDYHYICIKEDFSDLIEKLQYYINHQDKAAEIIRNANTYAQQFKNRKRERLISLLVVKKYFELVD